MRPPLARRMAEDRYDGYAYAYPHKTAYRPLDPPVPLEEAWADEDRRNLFLYVHLPFCEMRCGFCNLFTTVRPDGEFVERTLEATLRQSAAVAAAVRPERIAQVAVGGGTPTWLSVAQAEALFGALARDWPLSWSGVPVSVEASPGTVTPEKLAFLRSAGVDRLSLGVQSFVPEDLADLRRPAAPGSAERACAMIREAGFPVFNLDLIYGNEGQDARSWRRSLDAALEWRPEELYLYPLYIGRLTRLDHLGRRPGQRRRDLYRQARDLLLQSGYRQISMRFFRRADVARSTDHCCQDDGMVGLGPGARSYTRSLHYSTEYAVGLPGVRQIVEAFHSSGSFATADFGARLDEPEQKVRWLLKSLLRVEGVSLAGYEARFGGCVSADFGREIAEMEGLGLAEVGEGVVRLTAEGLAWTDTLGPWLYSEAVVERMSGCTLR